jgi:hypothetical protein
VACPALGLEASGDPAEGGVLWAAIHAVQDNKVNVSKIVLVMMNTPHFIFYDDVDRSLEGLVRGRIGSRMYDSLPVERAANLSFPYSQLKNGPNGLDDLAQLG